MTSGLYLRLDERWGSGQSRCFSSTRDQGSLYAVGRIVIITPHGAPLKPEGSLDDLQAALANGRVTRFTIAKPEHAPYGRRAEDIRNIIEARVSGHDPANSRTLLDWAGLTVEAAPRAALPVGQPVFWVIPDRLVVLHRRDRPSRGEHENPVAGTIVGVLPIGQTAHLTLRPRNEPASRSTSPCHCTWPAATASLPVCRGDSFDAGRA